jgi:putative ATP-dependent endonuclease of OLD family
MAASKKPKAADDQGHSASTAPLPTATQRPRLHKLRVSNFRCIGPKAVEIELDDIVVLVGPNNAGKTSILRAYEVVMEHGTNEGKLTIDDFPNNTIAEGTLPTIELETVVFDTTAPGPKWVRTDPVTQEMFVREKWTWAGPGTAKKVGWDVSAGSWHATEGPWGAPNVAQAYRPKPHRVAAFADPNEQAKQVVEVLKEALDSRIKEAKKKRPDGGNDTEASEYEKLIAAIGALQKSIADDATKAVDELRSELAGILGKVFPGYAVSFDARPEDEIEKTLSLFKVGPLLRMGPSDGHQATLERQGSGACRTLLWAALRILAERAGTKTDKARPHLLLMDEPENCLHPDAIREARRVLYALPDTKNWQVMITTHSPVFIDLSRNNTSIVRVERGTTGAVEGTTIYRPTRAHLDDDDKAELKLLNMCDPYVAEFFFGGRTIVVEGDTEYTAFNHVISRDPEKYKGLHIVRARGKACVVSLAKILNQFDNGYAILHDSDTQFVVTKKTKKRRANSAWTENGKILAATADGRSNGRVRLLASVPNFERAFFEDEAKEEKPYTAILRMRADEAAFGRIVALLDALRDSNATVPTGAVEWKTIEDLSALVDGFEPSDKAEPVNA